MTWFVGLLRDSLRVVIPAGIVDQDGPESDLDGVHGGGVHADVGGDPRHVAVRHPVAPQLLLQLSVTHLK